MLSILIARRVNFANVGSLLHSRKFPQPAPCFCNRFNARLKSEIASQHRPSDFNDERAKSMFNYLVATAFFIAGCGFAAIPMYNSFCSVRIRKHCIIIRHGLL